MCILILPTFPHCDLSHVNHPGYVLSCVCHMCTTLLLLDLPRINKFAGTRITDLPCPYDRVRAHTAAGDTQVSLCCARLHVSLHNAEPQIFLGPISGKIIGFAYF